MTIMTARDFLVDKMWTQYFAQDAEKDGLCVISLDDDGVPFVPNEMYDSNSYVVCANDGNLFVAFQTFGVSPIITDVLTSDDIVSGYFSAKAKEFGKWLKRM